MSPPMGGRRANGMGRDAPAWGRGKGPRPTIRATTPPCCVTATPATSLTRTGTGRVTAIIADIDRRRHPLHIAIENFGNDANIGAVVRTANAFAVDTVHIVGRRRWNRRGAMVTDRYQRLRHHDTTAELLTFAADAGLTVVAVDNVPGAVATRTHRTTARLPADLRPGGARHHRRREGRRRRHRVHRAIRIDPQHQCRGCCGHRHAHLDHSTWGHFQGLVGQDRQHGPGMG